MLWGLRRKHVLLGSLLLSCVLVLLVISSHTPAVPAQLVVFHERRIASHSEGGGAAGNGVPVIEEAPLDATEAPQQTHVLQEPRSAQDYPGPALNSTEREALKKLGILLVQDEDTDAAVMQSTERLQHQGQQEQKKDELIHQQKQDKINQLQDQRLEQKQTQQLQQQEYQLQEKRLQEKRLQEKRLQEQRLQEQRLQEQQQQNKWLQEQQQQELQEQEQQEQKQQQQHEVHLSREEKARQFYKQMQSEERQRQLRQQVVDGEAEQPGGDPPPQHSQTSSVSVVSRVQGGTGGTGGTGGVSTGGRPSGGRITGGRVRSRLLGGGRMAPHMTYQDVWKMAEGLVRHTVRTEFREALPDTQFTPGEVVPASQQRRVILLSTWRSGSSFLGDLLKSYPGTYFSFEPLHHLLKNLHLQEGPLVDVVLDLLRSIMTCNMSHQDEYVNYMRNNTFLIDHNTRVWNSCERNRALCFDKQFLSSVCRYFPVNVMKTVRMGLAPVVTLLEDPSLDLRVVHLVRDPRGALHSRMQLEWCKSLACSDPTTVCADLMTDLKLSQYVQERFPDRYLLVRYEDLGLEAEAVARQIFSFLGLTYHPQVDRFVRDHTSLTRRFKKKKNNAYSTYRDSKSTTFAWRDALSYDTLQGIQDVCRDPLEFLKLRVFDNEEDYHNYTIPVLLN